MYLVDCLIQDPIQFQKTFTYSSAVYIEKGIRVWIDFNHRKVVGFVLNCYIGNVDYDVKEILEIIDSEPILDDELMKLADFIAYRTISPLIKVYQLMLPKPLSISKKMVKPKTIKMIKKINQPTTKLSSKASQALDFLSVKNQNYTEFLSLYKGCLKTLLKYNLVEVYEEELVYHKQFFEIRDSDIELTNSQLDAIKRVDLFKYQTYLLFGPTGSGKTEVYFNLARQVLANNKSVLFVLPEISLTRQMIQRINVGLGIDVVVYHSNLSDQERYQQYQRLKNEKVNFIVSTRSGVFLPIDNLGLIIIDEEHDHSYKQDHQVLYDARDVADFRAKYHNIPLILGSASPRLETYAKALKGVYELLEITNHSQRAGFDCCFIDLNQSLKQLSNNVVMPELLSQIRAVLSRKQQVLLLLNRRGYSQISQCPKCLKTYMCPNCDMSLTYHKYNHSYQCHLCGYTTFKNKCSCCQENYSIMKGIGTQQLEDIIKVHFPLARVNRIDGDVVVKKNAHQKIIDDLINHKIDILIGTQMIAKGLNVENIGLVGIIDVDQSLLASDYLAHEKTFNLILQAAGRTGRGRIRGKVLLQTYNPEHYVLNSALSQDYVKFFKYEMKFRHQTNIPPYTYLVEIIFSHKYLDKIEAVIERYIVAFREYSNISVLGPARLKRISNLYRERLLLRSKDLEAMISACYRVHELLVSENRGVRVSFNVNPGQLCY